MELYIERVCFSLTWEGRDIQRDFREGERLHLLTSIYVNQSCLPHVCMMGDSWFLIPHSSIYYSLFNKKNNILLLYMLQN